jgi:exopolysaccharide biosynthesis operon protein EpsL
VPRRLGFAGLIAGLAVALGAVTARADDEDTFNFTLGASQRYDTNLFLLPSYTTAEGALGTSRKADWITTAYAGFAIDKPYGLQRFQLQGKLNFYRYDTFNYLDFNGKNYRAAWLWSLTPDMTGTLVAAQTQAPVSYADFRGRSQNIQTSQIQRAHADYRVTGGWHFTGAYDHTSFKNSTSFTQVGNSELDTLEAGVKYVAASGSTLTLLQRESTGNFLGVVPNPTTQLPTDFEQHETTLRGRWALSGNSTLDGEIGYLSRTNDPFPSRNFAGVVGKITHAWTPTGKLTINTNLGRNLFPFMQDSSSYMISNYLYFMPAWEITAKTTARMTLGYEHRDFEGAIVLVPALRRDKTATARLDLDWAPTRTLTLSTYVQHAQRVSNYINFNYVDTVAGVTAGLKF